MGTALASMKRIGLAGVGTAALGVVACAVSLWAISGTQGILGAGLALLMLAIAVIDLRYFIIPNELTAAALALALLSAALDAMPSTIESVAIALLRGAVTMLFFLAIRWVFRRLRQREGLGLGDVKLAFVAGAWLDWMLIPVAIEIAALAALVAYGAWRLSGSGIIDATSRLPFGLFFAPAIWLTWLVGALIFNV